MIVEQLLSLPQGINKWVTLKDGTQKWVYFEMNIFINRDELRLVYSADEKEVFDDNGVFRSFIYLKEGISTDEDLLEAIKEVRDGNIGIKIFNENGR